MWKVFFKTIKSIWLLFIELSLVRLAYISNVPSVSHSACQSRFFKTKSLSWVVSGLFGFFSFCQACQLLQCNANFKTKRNVWKYISIQHVDLNTSFLAQFKLWISSIQSWLDSSIFNEFWLKSWIKSYSWHKKKRKNKRQAFYQTFVRMCQDFETICPENQLFVEKFNGTIS